MAVTPMQKIRLYGMKKDLKKVLGVLQEGGIMQIEEVALGEGKKESELLQPLVKEEHELDYLLANIDFAIKTLTPYAPKRPIWAGKTTLGPESALGTLKEFAYDKVVKKCQTTEEKQVAARNEQNALGNEEALLIPWKNLKTSLNTTHETKTVRISYGTMPISEYETLHRELHALSPLTHVEKINEDDFNAYGVVIITKTHFNEAKTVLLKTKFAEVELPSMPGTVAERLKFIESRKKELLKIIDESEADFRDLAKHAENLQIVHDVLLWQKEEQTAREKLKGTEYSFVLTGWMPVEIQNEMEQKLQKISPSSFLAIIPAEEGEQSPILLRNKKIAWPFESVTKLYGFPLPHEVDPTPFLATFFIVFFALCLTDAGYGLLLFLIMFVVLKFFNLPQESRGLVKLLMWGGLVTMVAGYFFGGYFGLTTEQAPSFMVEGDAFKGQIINATAGNGPLTFLILALVLGIAQVLFGKMVDGFWKLKNGQIIDAILDSFLWVYFLLAIMAFGLSKSGTLVPSEYAPLAKWLVWGGVAALILTQGRKQKGLMGKLGLGVLSLYGLVGYLGDILSYSRIMALGLGTGIIAFAMNTIAGLAFELIPYVGFIFAIIVLILGHTMNLVLSALGAFIHSARLQFVEFFGKFMEGGGTPFKPFKRTCKYIVIQ